MKAITAKKPAGITPNAPLQEFYSRVLAYMFIAALIAAGTYTGFFSYSLLWVVPYALLYPHLAYFFTSRFKTHYPKLTYAIELCVDSLHAGTVLALIGYAIIPSLMGLLIITLSTLIIGGLRLMLPMLIS